MNRPTLEEPCNYFTLAICSVMFLRVFFFFSSPCFDEPALKATYEIVIEHPAGFNLISRKNNLTHEKIF